MNEDSRGRSIGMGVRRLALVMALAGRSRPVLSPLLTNAAVVMTKSDESLVNCLEQCLECIVSTRSY